MADNDKKQDEIKDEPSSAKATEGEEKEAETKTEVKPAEEPKVEEKKEESKPSAKLDKKLQDLAEKIEGLSLAEAATLAKALQDKFGITAAPVAAPPTAVPGAPTTAAGEEPATEQTTFNVILASTGANKISVIKALREINPQLGLKEAKDIADAPPKEILTGVNKETADEAKSKLEAAGATVELK